jgi:hypothetical protein
MNYYCSCQPGPVIPNISTSVLGPATRWSLPFAWQPNGVNCGAQTYSLTLLSTTAAVAAVITLAGTDTQINVSSPSIAMLGVYTYELTFWSASHSKTYTSAPFTITISRCIVTTYALTGCTILAEYLALDPARTDSCVTIT